MRKPNKEAPEDHVLFLVLGLPLVIFLLFSCWHLQRKPKLAKAALGRHVILCVLWLSNITAHTHALSLVLAPIQLLR